jgi:DNA repair/transcription protein MET18/MMS19
MSNYSITLWDSLKFEILNAQEEDLAEEALVALRNIALRLGSGLTSIDPKTPLATYLKPVTKECNEQLQEPQHKQAKPAGQILKTLGSSSTVAFVLIVKAILPPLLTLYQDADSIAKQKALLEFLQQLLHAALHSYSTKPTISDAGIANPLEPFKDRLFEMFSQALMSTSKEEVSFRVIALRCLQSLCCLRKYLEDNEIGMAVQYFDEIVLSNDGDGRDLLKNAAIEALVEVSKIKPGLIMDITFPAFMARLPDTCLEGDTKYLVTLEGLARVSVEKATSDTLVRRLFNRLDAVLPNPGILSYPQAILSTLHYVLGRRDLTADANLTSYFERVVGLIKRTAIQSSDATTTMTVLENPLTMVYLGRLACLIVRALDSHKQTSVCRQVYTLFCEEEEFTPVLLDDRKITEGQTHTLILSTFLLAGVGREVSLLCSFHSTFANADSLGKYLYRSSKTSSRSILASS